MNFKLNCGEFKKRFLLEKVLASQKVLADKVLSNSYLIRFVRFVGYVSYNNIIVSSCGKSRRLFSTNRIAQILYSWSPITFPQTDFMTTKNHFSISGCLNCSKTDGTFSILIRFFQTDSGLALKVAKISNTNFKNKISSFKTDKLFGKKMPNVLKQMFLYFASSNCKQIFVHTV